MENTLREFYPPIEPHSTDMLDIGGGHKMYYEESGNPNGKPALYVHGGPGGGTKPTEYRRYWDPEAYRIILFNQRGCGNSIPFGSLKDNTTWNLVEDMELLRKHLDVDRWQLLGGSWGSTLSLAYAEKYPKMVTELIVHGIFLLNKKELDWFYQGKGANMIHPEAWEEFCRPIPVEERKDFIRAYYKRFTSNNESEMNEAARAWSIWEGITSKLVPDPEIVNQFADPHHAIPLARIEGHYFINKGFPPRRKGYLGDYLLKNISAIRNIPGVIVQGRYDLVCPFDSAWELHKAWPEADFRIVKDVGHSWTEPGIIHELVSVTDTFRGKT